MLEVDPHARGAADGRDGLPPSERVSVPALCGVFADTTTSYKYVFLKSMLDVLEADGFQRATVDLDRVYVEMLVNAWYPRRFFRLSFGVADRLAGEADLIDFEAGLDRGEQAAGHREALRRQVRLHRPASYRALRYVQYRLLRPFFPELAGMPDGRVNRCIVELSRELFEERKPFYCFTDDATAIVMHHDWMLYFLSNLRVVRAFVCWEWLDYMQRRNPSVPNVAQKLFPPTHRAPLNRQREFWRSVMGLVDLRCIYTGARLRCGDFSLDHFLPWSFVAHDQPWNLIPASPQVNSAKSDCLPSLDRYLRSFVDIQHAGLVAYRRVSTDREFAKVIEPYVADLHLPDRNAVTDRTQLGRALESCLGPLVTLAASQGFQSDWEYDGR